MSGAGTEQDRREAEALRRARLFAHLNAGREAVPAGWMEDSKGRLVKESMVPEAAALEDQTVKTIAAYALELANQIARFRGHSFDDITAQQDLAAEKYGAKRKGGRRGNQTFTSFDGRLKVVVQVQD